MTDEAAPAAAAASASELESESASASAQAIYGRRDRAESFGAIADDYDRYRPSYPDALITELAARGGTEVVDVGCGTGKAALLLVAAGLHLLGVEVDASMAAVARTHGIEVEVGSFETWDDAGRRFDMITAAQSWHWVDPNAGAVKAARVLRPGGTLALFWNVHYLDTAVTTGMDEIYRVHAPSSERERRGGVRGRAELYGAPLQAAGLVDVSTREFPWEQSYSRDDFTGLLATYSDHQLLPHAQRAALLGAVGNLVDDLGGTIAVHYETHALLARAPSG